MYTQNFLVVLALIALTRAEPTHAKDEFNHDLNELEKEVLAEFKSLVADDLKAQDDYAHSESFLVRFLRARALQLIPAQEMLKKHLQWKKDHHIDTIHSEDWSHMRDDFPFHTDAVDKRGRPILYFPIGPSWDVSAAKHQGKLENLTRYGQIKSFDLASQIARNAGHARFLLIADMTDFSVDKHLCGMEMCLQFYGDFLNVYEDNYPQWPYRLLVVNASPAFDLVLKFIKPFMSPHTVEAMKVIPNRADWEPLLNSLVNKDQLSEELGGTKKYGKAQSNKKKETEHVQDFFKFP